MAKDHCFGRRWFGFLRSIFCLADGVESAAHLDYVRLADHGHFCSAPRDEFPTGRRSRVGKTRFAGRRRPYRSGSGPLGRPKGSLSDVLQRPFSRTDQGRPAVASP